MDGCRHVCEHASMCAGLPLPHVRYTIRLHVPHPPPPHPPQQSAATKWEANTEDLLLRRSFRYAKLPTDPDRMAGSKRRYTSLLESRLRRILPQAHPPLPSSLDHLA